MKFAAVIEYTPDKSKIAQFRPPHREYLMGLRKAGKAVMAGPFTDESGGVLGFSREFKEKMRRVDWGGSVGTRRCVCILDHPALESSMGESESDAGVSMSVPV